MTRIDTVYRVASRVVAGRLRTAVALLWFAGSGLAVYAGAAAALRRELVRGAPFPVLAAAGVGLGLATLKGRRWALAVGVLLVAAQPVPAAAAAWELAVGIPAERVANLRALGVDPTLGVAINLGYSLTGTAVAGWALTRLLTTCRRSAHQSS